MFYAVTTGAALLLQTIWNFVIPVIYDKVLKKRGMVYKGRNTISKIIKGYIYACLPYVNVIPAFVNFFALLCFIGFYDKLVEKADEVYTVQEIKRNYERKDSDKKEIINALILDGASELEIKDEMKRVNGYVGKKEKSSSYHVDPDFSKKEYDWACLYLSASNFIDSLFADVTIDKKARYEIVSDLVAYLKETEKLGNVDEEVLQSENENNYFRVSRDETVSNKVLEIINKHL